MRFSLLLNGVEVVDNCIFLKAAGRPLQCSYCAVGMVGEISLKGLFKMLLFFLQANEEPRLNIDKNIY